MPRSPISKPNLPGLEHKPHTVSCYFEEMLYRRGYKLAAGVDEAGRGCLAGPVVAASVILPRNCKIIGINDSKRLSPAKRESLFNEITKTALSYGIGMVEASKIDRINILNASIEAMKLAVKNMHIKPDFLLIDGRHHIDINIEQRAIVKGDAISISIAAASIIAKVVRDRLMSEFQRKYPRFSFSVHKGYSTATHRREIAMYGITPIHRETFKGTRQSTSGKHYPPPSAKTSC